MDAAVVREPFKWMSDSSRVSPSSRERMLVGHLDGGSRFLNPSPPRPVGPAARRLARQGVDRQPDVLVGNAHEAELIDVFVDDTVIQIWSKNHLIKTVAGTRTGPVRKVRASASNINRLRSAKHQLALDRGHHPGGAARG